MWDNAHQDEELSENPELLRLASDREGHALRVSKFLRNGRMSCVYRTDEREICQGQESAIGAEVIARTKELLTEDEIWLLQVFDHFGCFPYPIVQYLGRHRANVIRKLRKACARRDKDVSLQLLFEQLKKNRVRAIIEDQAQQGTV